MPTVVLRKRAGFTNRNRVVDLIGRLHSNIFFQPHYMLNDVNVKIRMTRSKNEFALVWTGANLFRVSIISAALFVRKVKLNPSVYLPHGSTRRRLNWQSTPAAARCARRLQFQRDIETSATKSYFPVNQSAWSLDVRTTTP